MPVALEDVRCARLPWMMLKTTGTKSSVAKVATSEAADHGAAERRVLFAAVAQTKRHRRHADDHGQRRHQHRAEARRAGLDGGDAMALPVSPSRSRAKLTTRIELAVATPMHMMAPVSAGTDSVVSVMNSIQIMPASAPGNAVMMMNGSSQDWKLTTIRR